MLDNINGLAYTDCMSLIDPANTPDAITFTREEAFDIVARLHEIALALETAGILTATLDTIDIIEDFTNRLYPN